MEVEFDLTKNKHTTENINYNYYSTTFYKNQYEKTIQNGGYIKLPYPSHSNRPNLVSSVFPDHYVTTHLYILKKSHSIRGVSYDGELVIEHISTTNNNKRLYAYIPLKTSKQIPANKIDDLIAATYDSVVVEFDDFFMMEQIKEAILYDTQQTKTLIFTQPILVKTAFDSINSIELCPSYSSQYSVLSVKPLLGINISNVAEGFKEGIDKDVVAAAYCQPIDETDPNIGENADVIIPLNSKLSVNDATNNSLRTIMNFFAFFVLILAAVTVVPIMYNMFIVELVLDNKELLLPQEKLNRLCSIDIYISIILFGLAFSFIHYGIANNLPVFTSIGFYFLIFYLSAFLYFQYNRTMNKESTEQFLKKFLLGDSNKELPSFDKVKNDISGLILQNLKILFMNIKTKKEEIVNSKGNIETRIIPEIGPDGNPVKELSFLNIFLLLCVYGIMYSIASNAGVKSTGGSILMSLPFYLFLFAVYVLIFVKYQKDRLLIDSAKK